MPRKPIGASALRRQKLEQKLDVCAIAAAQMCLGEFKYEDNERRVFDENGRQTVNWNVLQRILGNKKGEETGHFQFNYRDDDYFQKRFHYELRRRTDPTFARGNENEVWSRICNMALTQMYSRVEQHPDKLTFTEMLKILDLGVKAGVASNKMAGTDGNAALLKSLSPDKRKALVEGLKKKKLDEIKQLESENFALDGADLSDV